MRYLQIFLNQPQGYLFCLVEGPDKESCARVHQEAHGNIACNILEITESDFSALLANKSKDGLDFTVNPDGSLDSGNRAILALELLGEPDDFHSAKAIVNDVFRLHEGRPIERLERRLIAIFDSGSSAVNAALVIRDRISDSALSIEVRMGVDIGPPLKEKGDFFEDVCRSASLLSFVSLNGGITVSSNVMELCKNNGSSVNAAIKMIDPVDRKFLGRVMDYLENAWHQEDITTTGFARELGMSKSQLGRKLKSLSSLSPNDFLKEFRLRKAVGLMEDRSMNVAEVTMAIGFTNPSYFAKCFRKRFGKAPSGYKVSA